MWIVEYVWHGNYRDEVKYVVGVFDMMRAAQQAVGLRNLIWIKHALDDYYAKIDGESEIRLYAIDQNRITWKPWEDFPL